MTDRLKQYGEAKMKDYLMDDTEYTEAHYDLIRFFFSEYPDLKDKYGTEFKKRGIHIDELRPADQEP